MRTVTYEARNVVIPIFKLWKLRLRWFNGFPLGYWILGPAILTVMA